MSAMMALDATDVTDSLPVLADSGTEIALASWWWVAPSKEVFRQILVLPFWKKHRKINYSLLPQFLHHPLTPY
jgi:hypothetical protein